MNVTIKINCDNAAFEGSPEGEVSRILQALSRELEANPLYFPTLGTSYNGMTFDLRDYNGNVCGKFSVTGA